MSKIYKQSPSGKILETQNWKDLDKVKNGVIIMHALSDQEEEEYRNLKNIGATDSAIWKALRANKEKLDTPTSKERSIQIELTIPLHELTKIQLILIFTKYAGYELSSMLSMTKDDIIKLIQTISPSDIVKINLDNK